MIEHIYGEFDDKQFDKYKTKLHKELFWLLIYKDPKTKDKFPNLDFDKYFNSLMRKINGLNQLLFYPVEIVGIMSLLQAAYIETKQDNFDFMKYRKCVLDAHSLIDKIGGGVQNV